MHNRVSLTVKYGESTLNDKTKHRALSKSWVSPYSREIKIKESGEFPPKIKEETVQGEGYNRALFKSKEINIFTSQLHIT